MDLTFGAIPAIFAAVARESASLLMTTDRGIARMPKLPKIAES
jgi:hypothetical protein